MNSVLRSAITILIILIIGMLGYLRDEYIIRIRRGELPVLIHRYDPDIGLSGEVSENREFSGIRSNPRWYSSLAYSAIYTMLGMALIHIYYGDWRLTKYTGLIYIGLITLAGLCIGISLVTGKFDFTYHAIQPLKNFIQSPLLALILLISFKLTRKTK